ncbi:MAG: trimethylamine methyltransferase [Desulfobacteraceae bacterium]|nr:MAG: trimethylamine methyltransferase [Desulfobacteraceae bacterium]
MIDRMQTFTVSDLSLIHDTSMEILSMTGINFNDLGIANIFKKNGFPTDGTRVYLDEPHVMAALQSVRPEFTVHSRNPDRNVKIGNEHYVFLPTGGAPQVADLTGSVRPATFKDFDTCCRLLQTSDQLDMGGYLMVQPNDIPVSTAHLDMLCSYMTLCDKPIFGACGFKEAALDTIEMAGIIFDGKEKIKDFPVMVSVVNAMSPLQFSKEQGEVIVEMALHGQPIVITNMILAGASGPISLPSLLALLNAEVLAGIVLTQLVNPGTPVLYGTATAPMDMKTMVSAVGSAEAVKIASAAIQLARFYNIPCRAGGSLTDAHLPDAQALSEGSLMLSTVVRNGANFIYHACGQMGSFISMSFEKWLLDEEVCRLIRYMTTPINISKETMMVENIVQVGIGGQYLTHPTTFQQFRTLTSPKLFNRKDISKWATGGALSADQVASKALEERLSAYQKPWIDSDVEQALIDYVNKKKLDTA